MKKRNNLIVNIGDVKFLKKEGIISSYGIGSCIVVLLYDVSQDQCSMTHILLPEEAPGKVNNKTKYAKNAIDHAVNQLKKNGSNMNDLLVFLFGGANVLNSKKTQIGLLNIKSVKSELKKLNIPICRKSIGGFRRRSVKFDFNEKVIFYTLGDNREKVFWSRNK